MPIAQFLYTSALKLAYISGWPQLLDDRLYPVHYLLSHCGFLRTRRHEIVKVHDFFMQP